MKKHEITIAIVKYKGLDENHFIQSLSSAIAQIAIKPLIEIYTETESPSNVLDMIELISKNTDRIQLNIIPPQIRGNPSVVREFIVRKTRTKYLAFWDSDDVYTANRLWHQISLMEEKLLDLCFADFYFFEDDNNVIHEKTFFETIGYHRRDINILHENFVGLGITVWRTEFLKRLLPFPATSNLPLDWWLAISTKLNHGKASAPDKPLGFYRSYNASRSKLFHSISKIDKQLLLELLTTEKKCKIDLYSYFAGKSKTIQNLLNYYSKLDISKNFNTIYNNLKRKKFINIWGGLLTYDKTFI